MVLTTKNFNIFGVHWTIRLLPEGILKNEYIRGDCLKRWAWTVYWFKGGVFEGGWYPNARYDYFVPFAVIKNRFTKIKFKYFNGNCNYSSWPGWWILFLYALPHKGLAFWKNYLWTNLSFSYSLKITCILLRKVIYLKKMLVLSVKFTILISWPPISIPLILLSALMRLASTSTAVLYNNLVPSTKPTLTWWGVYLVKMFSPIASTSRACQSDAGTFDKD